MTEFEVRDLAELLTVSTPAMGVLTGVCLLLIFWVCMSRPYPAVFAAVGGVGAFVAGVGLLGLTAEQSIVLAVVAVIGVSLASPLLRKGHFERSRA